jgi:hypothetical protein
MAVIEIRKDPTERELMWFGVLLAVFAGLLGVVIYFKFHAPDVAFGVWGAGVLITIVYSLTRPLRRPLYVGWMYAAFPIGWVVSHIVMAVAYYVVVTPIGLLHRAVKPDPLGRRFRPELPTYWVEHRPDALPPRYFRQF